MAFGDGVPEQALGQRRQRQEADRARARRFAGDGDALRIAAEGRDIALDPFQDGDVVEQAIIARRLVPDSRADSPLSSGVARKPSTPRR
jgi:hypothetical protein